MKRIQSASSINMYKQCPRKYYYRYIEKLPDPPTIHTLRGNIVHEALEKFYAIEPEVIKDHIKELPLLLDKLMDDIWMENREALKQLDLSVDAMNNYYVESRYMLGRWVQKFLLKIKATELPFVEAFKKLTPSVEKHLISEEYGVRGYIDALYEVDDEMVKIVDYKTSRKDILTPEYKLQAGIYAVLVQEYKGVPPQVVIFDFLKGEPRELTVDEDLIKTTLQEIEIIHMNTDSDDIRDYPRKPSGLCKWSNERGSGQCPFYDICKPFGSHKD